MEDDEVGFGDDWKESLDQIRGDVSEVRRDTEDIAELAVNTRNAVYIAAGAVVTVAAIYVFMLIYNLANGRF